MVGPLTVVLMGVAGSGKTSVMTPLAARLGAAVTAEGDDFHPPANIAKMGAGEPLTDEDRWPWLAAIATWIGEREREGVNAVVSCSALRRRYRDVLREAHPSVRFVHLDVPRAELERRLANRTGHYMPASLLASQLETLERLERDEPGFSVDGQRTPDDLAEGIAARVQLLGSA